MTRPTRKRKLVKGELYRVKWHNVSYWSYENFTLRYLNIDDLLLYCGSQKRMSLYNTACIGHFLNLSSHQKIMIAFTNTTEAEAWIKENLEKIGQ